MFEEFRQKCYDVLREKAIRALDRGGIPEWKDSTKPINYWETNVPLEEIPEFMERPELMIRRKSNGVYLVGRNSLPIISYTFRRIAPAEAPDTFYAEGFGQ